MRFGAHNYSILIFLPPDWMVSERKVAEDSSLNRSPLLTTTTLSGWRPGFQLLREGLWSGQFSVNKIHQ